MRITVTQDHLNLLGQMDFDWDDEIEWGAVSSDPKRPFGNSSVERDVSHILGRDVDSGEARQLSIELSAVVQAIVTRALTTGEAVVVGTLAGVPWRAARLLDGSR